MKFKGVIFDLDGTLLDTIEDLSDSMNAVLEEKGLPVHPVNSYKIFVGDGVEVLVERALPEKYRMDKLFLEDCVEKMRFIYNKNSRNKTKPYKGIPELLNELKKKGYRMGILSNKPDDATQSVVQHYFEPGLFDSVIGRKPEYPKKPAPDGALKVMRDLGLSPEEVFYLGDTSTDMQTAVGAGFFPAGALWGFRGAEELIEHGARAIFKNPADIIPML